ncbi:MAG: glycine cleavage system protein H [Burkholderiaceae bacterium]
MASPLDQLAPDVLYAPEQDMWVRFNADGTARVGATHLVSMHGQFMLFTPRPAGSIIARDRSMGVMETGKTAVAIHAPLSCKIIEANSSAVDNIHLIIADSYGAGWLFQIEPTALDAERETLLDAAAYREWLQPRLAEKLKPPIDDFYTEDFDIDPNRGY